MPPQSRAVLIILDGFGIGMDSPYNAIKNAKMPFYRGCSRNTRTRSSSLTVKQWDYPTE